MRRIGLTAIVVVALAGCAPAGPASSGAAAPSVAAAPSKACGGYHIAIANAGTSELEVRINGQPVTTVVPGATANIAEYGEYPAPPMPWDVAAISRQDGAVVFSAHLVNDGSDGRWVRVGDRPADEVALALFVC
jgi:hypothetical protein